MAANARRYRKNQRKRRGNGLLEGIKMAAVVAVLVALVVLGIRLFSGVPSENTFCEGVYVNGVSLGGLTHEEGVTTVTDLIHRRINQDTYVLTYQGREWKFTPSEFGAQLDLTNELTLAWNFGHTGSRQERRQQAAYVKDNPVHYDRAVTYDEEKLDAFIDAIKAEIDVEPVSAEVTVLPDQVLEISQSVDGLTLSAEELKSTLVNSLLSGTAETIELAPQVVKPQYTTEELRENTQLIVTYRTPLSGTSNRKNNVRRALRDFNGLRVNPDQLISFNDIAGKRTKANGYFEAPEYDFTEVKTGIGGGTCQASTTLYGAVLMANLDVVVRGNHSMTVGYVDPSLDAAVSENKDFRFVNNLDYPIYIYTTVSDKWATVYIYGPPCEHEIVLESNVISEFPPKGNRYDDDSSGKYVYYTDEQPVLKSEGKNGIKSQAFRVYYDRETGAVVQRQDMDVDTYYASQPVYWRGVHIRE